MYLGKTKRYQFYSAEVDHCPESKLRRIAEACRIVENEVWNPSMDFMDYIRDQSAVIYAKQNGVVVGFALLHLYLRGDTLVVHANECMVMKAHHGRGLPNMFLTILVAHIRRDNRLKGLRRSYRSVTFVSMTVNFKLMEGFRTYSRLLSDRSTFKPDESIDAIAKEYIQHEELKLLVPPRLDFVRGAFPGSVKVEAKIKTPDFVPAEFHIERGDAFLFVCRISKFWFLWLMSKYLRIRHGFHFSNRILPIGRLAQDRLLYVRGKK